MRAPRPEEATQSQRGDVGHQVRGDVRRRGMTGGPEEGDGNTRERLRERERQRTEREGDNRIGERRKK